jgi:hypothetical protein
MQKKLLLLLALASWPSYSYSESLAPYWGTTGNAITDQSLNWSMGNVLPEPPGLDIQNVIYSYTIQKESGEWVTVHVQNKNANGTGYIFRETDEWKPGTVTGMGINKVVPVGDLPRELWGPGSIEVEGNGSVNNAQVVYTYKVTPCYDPQFDPNCPNYVVPVPNIVEVNLDDLYDVFDDENVDLERNKTVEQDDINLEENERKKKEEEEEAKRKYRLEKALSVADAASLLAENARINAMNMASVQKLQTYVIAGIPGGVYNDAINLPDADLPDGKNGLRNGLAQQLLHKQMVEMQYNLNTN